MLRLLAAGLAVVSAKVYFQEEFNEGWRERWVDSTWKAGESAQGKFEVVATKDAEDAERDQGLKTTEDARFFGTSAHFDGFSNKGKDLVIQYQMRHEQSIECGGGYLKLGAKMSDATTFGDPTPYNIMFGPDQCGGTKRTHLIFTHKEKNHLRKNDITWADTKLPTLFTLIVKPDNSYVVNIDQVEQAKGKITDDFDVLPPQKIKDPALSKPDDWVDEEEMEDPDAKKPDDWVEEKRIKDPKAEKPEDWDDEEDGEWEAPMIDNPDFKGEWKHPMIKNPKYKGQWVHPEIDNPDYFTDDNIYAFAEFAFVGIDVWQVKGGTVFDNIIIADDIEDANTLAEKTWKPLLAHLKVKEEEQKKKDEEEQKKKDEEDKEKDTEKTKEDDDDDLEKDKDEGGDDDL